MFYVYILRCEDNSLYTGITTDVRRRFLEHIEGKIKGAKYTRSHRPVKIEAVWEMESKTDAARLEYRIKRLEKSKKERLVSGEIQLCDVIDVVESNLFRRANISSL